jgi:hypothetical protein
MKTYEVAINILTKAGDEVLADIRVDANTQRDAIAAAEARMTRALRAGTDIRINGCREV